MNWSYLFKHWFSTILVAPILSDIINYYYTDIQTLFNLTSVYPITVIFGLFFFTTNLYHTWNNILLIG